MTHGERSRDDRARCCRKVSVVDVAAQAPAKRPGAARPPQPTHVFVTNGRNAPSAIAEPRTFLSEGRSRGRRADAIACHNDSSSHLNRPRPTLIEN